MIEITCNDRLGKKVRVKCNPDDTIGDLKKLIAAQTGTNHERIVLKKWYNVFKDNITLADYEIHDGMNIELYYQWKVCPECHTQYKHTRFWNFVFNTTLYSKNGQLFE